MMYETLKKMSFYTKGFAEIHIQKPFFDMKKGICKILILKIQLVCTCFGAPFAFGSSFFFFFLKKTKILIFGGISKILKLIVFGQI
jgi:hypothetical protein